MSVKVCVGEIPGVVGKMHGATGDQKLSRASRHEMRSEDWVVDKRTNPIGAKLTKTGGSACNIECVERVCVGVSIHLRTLRTKTDERMQKLG